MFYGNVSTKGFSDANSIVIQQALFTLLLQQICLLWRDLSQVSSFQLQGCLNTFYAEFYRNNT
jgi:hypothetical protein